jgi:hypothetical protein
MAAEGLALFAVAVAPWLLVLAGLLAPLAIWISRATRRRADGAGLAQEV